MRGKPQCKGYNDFCLELPLKVDLFKSYNGALWLLILPPHCINESCKFLFYLIRVILVLFIYFQHLQFMLFSIFKMFCYLIDAAAKQKHVAHLALFLHSLDCYIARLPYVHVAAQTPLFSRVIRLLSPSPTHNQANPFI